MSAFRHPYPHVHGHPSLAEVEVTTACNARCVFCPRHLFPRPAQMTRPTFEQLLARVLEAGITHVKLVGLGEPTLHPDLLWMMRRLSGAGVSAILNTNGSRLHRLDVDELLSLCAEIVVSVHSLDPATHRAIFGEDFYDQLVANLDALLAANERQRRTITFYAVLTTLNRDAVATLERYRSRVRIRTSGCTNRGLEGFAEELMDLDASAAHNHYGTLRQGAAMCGYADAAVVVDATGRYLVCTNDVQRDGGVGDVFHKSVSQAFAEVRAGLGGGRFGSCRHCENFEPYRQQLLAKAGA